MSGGEAASDPPVVAPSPTTGAVPLQRRPSGGSGGGPDVGDAPSDPAQASGAVDPSGTSGAVRASTRRDQYIDGLRALALVRVMAYHTFGWIWLPVVFPSMGVMFALGGSLVAASLSAASSQAAVLRRRIRRLLPPLWLYGAVLVTAMAVQGWSVTETAGTPLTWRTALYWILPLADPPGSAWGYDYVLPLWYIRTYLWLMLLSPFLLWLSRRYPLQLLAVPVVVMLAIGQDLVGTDTATGDTVVHLATFGACWLLGFAHHDGRIARLPRGRTVAVALALMASGLAYALTHQQPGTRWDIDDIDPANALYSAGAVLLLLRLYPRRTFLERMPRLSKLVSAMNARAMTIYLWGNLCIWGATPVIESNPLTLRVESTGLRGMALQFVVAVLLMVVVVLAVGWVEDVAAGRRPRLNPWPRPGRTPRTAPGTPGAKRTASRVPNGAIAVIATTVGAVLVVAVVTVSPQLPGEEAAGPGVLPVAGPIAAGPGAPSPTRYPLHENIAATVFWIGAVAQADAGEDGQSMSSAWDALWAEHFGGCDGRGAPGVGCASDVELRSAPTWFPTSTVPKENPFYVGLPYNDLVSSKSTDRRQIPWAGDPGFATHVNDRSVSFVKNRWVSVSGPGGTCYAQVEDSGPGTLDPDYVMGTARPADVYGINLSPAVYRCVGLGTEAGSGAVAWRFVDAPEPGPWAQIVTTRQVS